MLLTLALDVDCWSKCLSSSIDSYRCNELSEESTDLLLLIPDYDVSVGPFNADSGALF